MATIRIIVDGRNAKRVYRDLRDEARDFGQEAEKSNRRAQSSTGSLADEIKRLSGDYGEQTRRVRQHAREVEASERGLSRVSAVATRLGPVLAGAFSVAAVVQWSRELYQAELQLERIQTRLRIGVGGDPEAGAESFDFVLDEAERLGLGLVNLADGWSRVSVATRGTALEGQASQRLFVSLAESAAALGLEGSDLEGILRAVEQMISKGNVSAEELRGQLGERLPGAFNLAAQAMGVTTSELNDMLDRGEVLATDLLPKLADELHNTYGPEASKNVERLSGASASLETAWFRLKTNLTDSDTWTVALQTIESGVSAIADELERANQAGDDVISRIERQQGVDLTAAERGRIRMSGRGDFADEQWQQLVANAQTEAAVQRRNVENLQQWQEERARIFQTAAQREGESLEQLRRQFSESISGGSDPMMDALIASVEDQEKGEKAAKAHASALDSLLGRYDKWGSQIRSIGTEIETLQRGLDAGEVTDSTALRVLDEIGERIDQLRHGTAADPIELDIRTDRFEENIEDAADFAIEAAGDVDDAFLDALTQQHAAEEFKANLRALEEEWTKTQDRVAENLTRGIQESFSDAFYSILRESDLSWESIGESLLDLFARTASELLASWVVLEAQKTVITARAAAERSAIETAAQGGIKLGGGGGGGILGGLGKLFGIGGGAGAAATYGSTGATVPLVTTGAGSAYTAAIGAGGTTAAGTTAATTAGSGGLGGLSATGWGIVAAAAAAALMHQGRTSGRAEAEGSIRWGDDGLSAGIDRINKQARGGPASSLQSALAGATNAALEMLSSLGLSARDLRTGAEEAEIELRREGRGKKTQWVVELANGVVQSFGGDMEAAMEYAAIQAVKTAPKASLDPIVQRAIEQSAATTLEDFREQMAVAMEVANLGLDPIQLTMRDSSLHFDNLRESITSILGPSRELEDALRRIGEAESQADADIRNRILGIQESPEERIRREAAAYNAEVQLRVQREQLSIADLQRQETELEVEIALLQGEAAVTEEKLRLRQKALAVDADLVQAEANLLGIALGQLAAVQAAIAEAQARLGEFSGNLISEQDIRDAIRRASSAGSRGISGAARRIDSAADKFERGTERLNSALDRLNFDDSVTALTEEEQVRLARQAYLADKAGADAGNLQDRIDIAESGLEYLRLLKEYSGGGDSEFGNFREQFLAVREELQRFQGMTLREFRDGTVQSIDRLHDTAREQASIARAAIQASNDNTKTLKVVLEEVKELSRQQLVELKRKPTGSFDLVRVAN